MSDLPSSVLFACTLNSVRSPMAEALAKRFYGRRAYFDSAGVRAGDLDGFTVSVLDEVGVDIHRHTVKTLDQIDPSEFELIVTLSPEAHHAALELTRDAATRVEYWPTPDPSAVEDDRARRLEAYRQVREMLSRRMRQRFGASGAVEV
jgi:protein-tyrosine-phosphatase